MVTPPPLLPPSLVIPSPYLFHFWKAAPPVSINMVICNPNLSLFVWAVGGGHVAKQHKHSLIIQPTSSNLLQGIASAIYQTIPQPFPQPPPYPALFTL